MLEESGLDAELRQLAQQELRESEELEEKLTLELRTLLLLPVTRRRQVCDSGNPRRHRRG